MKNFRYILEPYKGLNTRHTCPKCGKKHVFTRYIDVEKKEFLPFKFGKCNREINCGYHFDPYKEKYWENENFQSFQNKNYKPSLIVKPKSIHPSFHPFELVERSLKDYEYNSFVTFIFSKFGPIITKQLVKEYYLGTSKKYRKTGNGAVVFWNIDISGKVRSGKIMGYDPQTGKRVKEPYPLQNWVHSVLGIEDFNLVQCFYGEHLLKKYPFKKVAIVESEKTAIISSVYFPQYVWLASGNLNGINEEKSRSLQNRNVELFPDLSKDGKAFEIWQAKSKTISSFAKSVKVNDLLEKIAPHDHKQNGFDLGDYFSNISLDEWNLIGKGKQFHFDPISKVYLNENGYPASWDYLDDWKESKLSKLQEMTKKNPLIKSLIEKFDLIEI